mmetsp:Transcript_18169/g.43827  ORF Transcript_18169/g.43827 Transcript_18169/m.43827 type:complete len:115 (+) Transcript_18169:285-629(+)
MEHVYIEFQVECTEAIEHGRLLSKWSAFFVPDRAQFYIAAPTTICSSSKSSLVSLLEVAEAVECTTAWMYVDRKRPDFIAVVSTFKYLGFQLAETTIKDKRENRMFALLRYELE